MSTTLRIRKKRKRNRRKTQTVISLKNGMNMIGKMIESTAAGSFSAQHSYTRMMTISMSLMRIFLITGVLSMDVSKRIGSPKRFTLSNNLVSKVWNRQLSIISRKPID